VRCLAYGLECWLTFQSNSFTWRL